MRIAVLGAGAIGCLFGFRLDRSGQDVVLIHHRASVVRAINKQGVVVRELSGRVSKAQIRAKQYLSGKDDPDLILFTVKAYDTINAAKLLQSVKSTPRLGLLSLQNGLGNVEVLSRYTQANSIVAGSTTEGALQTAPGRIVHSGSGSTWIGETDSRPSKRCRVISRILQRAGFKTEVSGNIQGVIWSKAIVNSAINPVSALTGAKNGDLLLIRSLRNVTEKVVEESYAVSRAKGVRTKPDPKTLLKEILRLASSNRSSMLQDVEAGRKTEIHQLNGQIVKEGSRFGVPTPYNQLLLDLVSGLEASNQRA
jgi:2-dehydropantoate 2-reductase